MSKRVRQIASAGVALCLALACEPSEERSERMREDVRSALAEGDRPRALSALGSLRRALPASPETAIELAQLLVAAGSAPEAGWLLEEAVRTHPERADLRLALARSALLLGNPSLARESAAMVTSADSVAAAEPGSEEHLAALLVQASAELALGDLEAALADLGEAERLHPDRPAAKIARISALYAERRSDDARVAIEALLAEFDNDDDHDAARLRRQLQIALAQVQAQTGEIDAAIEALASVVEESPSDPLAWRAWLALLIQQGRGEEALAAVDVALGGEDPPPGLESTSALLRARLGRVDEAASALRVIAEGAESPASYLELLDLLFQHDRAAEAESVIEEALTRFPAEPRLRLMRADYLLHHGRVDEARRETARFAQATFAGDPQVEYLKARLVLAGGDAEEAAERLRKLAPKLDRAPTHFWLGRALEKQGDFEGARRRYALAMRRDPTWTPPISALAAIEARRGNLHEVAAHAQSLVQRAPWRLEGYVLWVDALANLGEGPAAERVARRSLERFPDRSEPRVLLAKALRTQGRTDEALAALDEIREAGPGEFAERVLTLGMGARVSEGIALAEDLLSGYPESAALHAAHAALLFAEGESTRGAAATDRALEIAPDELRPLRLRCEFRASIGAWAAARSDCARYLESRPGDASAHFVLGVIAAQQGDIEAAIAAYRRSAALDERGVDSRNNLAQLLADSGDVEGALDAAQQAYRLDSEDPYVLDTLGSLYLREGRVDRAVSLLERARAAAPDLSDASLNLARAYIAGGRFDEARELLVAVMADPLVSASLKSGAEEAFDSLP